MNQTALTVTQLNGYIKQMMESDFALTSVWIRGEISNYKRHSSGHLYLALKDEGGVLKSVMFKSSASRLLFEPENGMKVLAHGRVSVYERDGQYQLYIDKMEPDGIGALHIAFEQLKQRLEAEGLFDERMKKPLPAFPEKIAVVTSPTGAAIRDILNVLSRRYPAADVVICPVLVQGEGASNQIAGAIRFVNANKLADLIITGRGGGSIEDLWAFNEEGTARAIFESHIPVISAVGHETDFTIADFVADLRAPTPSAAAELAVPSMLDIKGELGTVCARMQFAAAKSLERRKERLDSIAKRISYQTILNGYNHKRLLVDSYTKEMENLVRQKLAQSRERFTSQAAALHALSPLAVMSRGYLVAQNEQGGLVKKLDDIQLDQLLSLRVLDGNITARVTQKEETHSK